MWARTCLIAIAALAMSTLSAVQASAEVQVTINSKSFDDPGDTFFISFDMPSIPDLGGGYPDSYFDVPYTEVTHLDFNGDLNHPEISDFVPEFHSVDYGGGGGLLLRYYIDNGYVFAYYNVFGDVPTQYYSTQYYSGVQNSPCAEGACAVFTPETYANQTDLYYRDVTVTISSVSSVPEPSTWAMSLLGFAAVGIAAYFRMAEKVHLAS